MPANRADMVGQRLGDPGFWGGLIHRAGLVAVLVVGTALLFAASLAPTAGVAAVLVDGLDDQLLDYPPLPDDLGEPWQRSVVLDREGNQLAVLREENRKVVRIGDIPRHVQEAIIATEDTEFRRHEGINWRAITRAALTNVGAGEITGGGSTITQQLVKNLVLTTEQTLDRKLQEAVYAIQLEQRLTKDQILEAYLNDTYFGNRVYGIGAAAEFYFGKDVSDLAVEDGALLAGIIRTPARNDPIDHPEAATERRNIVLGQMHREGYLAADEAARLQEEPMRVDIHPLTQPSSPFFVDYVRELLRQDPALGPDPEARERVMLRGGLTIHTTLHPGLQSIAQETIAEVLDGEDDPLGALTTVDPRTGEILTVGFGPAEYGTGPGQVSFNPAVPGLGTPGRQSGSAFKVFGIVAALEDGISPAYSFNAGREITVERPECPSPGYTAGNYGGAQQGVLDMAQATSVSSNTYFLHLLERLGPAPIIDVASRMGITTQMQEICSLILGTTDVYPLDMASAFGTLANAGMQCTPYAIAEIRDRHDRAISRGGNSCSRAVSEGIANRTTAMLRGPIEGGTAARHGRIGRPAAGKTGTTNDSHNAWFVGYIPQLSTAAWVGYAQPREMRHETCGGSVTGGCLPTIIWQRFMERAIEALELPVEEFADPPALPRGTVPDVVGLSEDEAVARLRQDNFAAAVEVLPDWRPAGTVFEQSPGGGTRTAEGTLVNLSISDGTLEMPEPETTTATTDP